MRVEIGEKTIPTHQAASNGSAIFIFTSKLSVKASRLFEDFNQIVVIDIFEAGDIDPFVGLPVHVAKNDIVKIVLIQRNSNALDLLCCLGKLERKSVVRPSEIPRARHYLEPITAKLTKDFVRNSHVRSHLVFSLACLRD